MKKVFGVLWLIVYAIVVCLCFTGCTNHNSFKSDRVVESIVVKPDAIKVIELPNKIFVIVPEGCSRENQLKILLRKAILGRWEFCRSNDFPVHWKVGGTNT